MRETALRALLIALSVLAAAGIFSCGSGSGDGKVVFIDLEMVIAQEKKRIFSRVLRGELAQEEAEERIGRFFIRFGEILAGYEKEGYLVLDSKSVLGGGRDVTGEILGELSARGEESE